MEMLEKKQDINRAVRHLRSSRGTKCQQLANGLSTIEQRSSPSNSLLDGERDLKTETQRWNDKQAQQVQKLSSGMLSSPCHMRNVTGGAICEYSHLFLQRPKRSISSFPYRWPLWHKAFFRSKFCVISRARNPSFSSARCICFRKYFTWSSKR
jgi:hypothetical protein